MSDISTIQSEIVAINQEITTTETELQTLLMQHIDPAKPGALYAGYTESMNKLQKLIDQRGRKTAAQQPLTALAEAVAKRKALFEYRDLPRELTNKVNRLKNSVQRLQSELSRQSSNAEDAEVAAAKAAIDAGVSQETVAKIRAQLSGEGG